ncbi:diglucosyl diacylglycerol synthase [Kyrpidia spormannii]|uniref:Processive diacylglycerol beta-glucosyltransferase n=1 Tax=Kyrpidia spormannii TaxID=2055160 RepID=A0A6F9EHS2_9BACL|nr:diglucosyl diacylglycerol synthase [Kyrpidia spormannii]CAB3395844.1 Processive diacylglycerol beta-glucosyltransferase [Kyrpidia spormannii]
MSKEPNILILTGSFGDGHLQVARVLRNGFQKQGVRKVRVLDLFAEAHPVINQVTRYAYLMGYGVAPSIYGWMYTSTRDMEQDGMFARLLSSFGEQTLRRILKEERPDAVINTFPVSTMPELRQKLGMEIPLAAVITDFALHQRWLHPAIDRYYVATEDLKQGLVRRQIPEDRVVVSGIPIRESFATPVDRNTIYGKYHFDPRKKIVLVMAGAYGVLQNTRQICKILAQDPDLEVVVVCGKNQPLRKVLETTLADQPSIHVFGFVEQIHEFMAVASAMITKAGAITLSEALAMKLPTLIFRPAPGQERENASYLAGKGAVIVFKDMDEFRDRVGPLLRDERRLGQMRQVMAALQKPFAADTIVKDTLDLIQSRIRMTPVHR